MSSELSIGAVSGSTGIARTALRYYEEIGIIAPKSEGWNAKFPLSRKRCIATARCPWIAGLPPVTASSQRWSECLVASENKRRLAVAGLLCGLSCALVYVLAVVLGGLSVVALL